MVFEWLSLSEVAKMLGVHPSTVRNWSDHGRLPVHRTQGGHRRYLRSEVELWMQSQRAGGETWPADFYLVVRNALRNTRVQISEGRIKDETWYCKLNDEAREQYRLSGRALLKGLIDNLNSDPQSGVAEADALGYEYASRGQRYGLDMADATRAFLFFRNALFEAMLAAFESAAVNSPFAWSDMFRRVTSFTDQVLLTLLETYAVFQRSRG
jgi:excisionase family DNA binding protein